MSSLAFPHKQISPTSQPSTKVFTHLSIIIFLVFWGQISWLQEAPERKSWIQICWRGFTCSLPVWWWCLLNPYGSPGVTVLALKASSLRVACEEMDPSNHWGTETKAKTNLQTLIIFSGFWRWFSQVRTGKMLWRFKLIVEEGRGRPWIHSVSDNIHRQSHVR